MLLSLRTIRRRPSSCRATRSSEERSTMEQRHVPDAVQQEIAWRLQGGTPYDVQAVHGVRWDENEYPHVPLVAIVNRHDPTHTHYLRTREEVEGLFALLRDAMTQAWPDAATWVP